MSGLAMAIASAAVSASSFGVTSFFRTNSASPVASYLAYSRIFIGRPSLSSFFSRSSTAAELLMASRRGLEQRLGIGMLRVGKHVGCRALLDDDALLHHREAVADLGCDAQVVGDEEHREIELLSDLVQQLEHLGLHRDVERRHRLIADQQHGLHRQCARDANALALPAGELVRIALQR